MVGCRDQKVGSRGELDCDDSPMPITPRQNWTANCFFCSSVTSGMSYPSANSSYTYM